MYCHRGPRLGSKTFVNIMRVDSVSYGWGCDLDCEKMLLLSNLSPSPLICLRVVICRFVEPTVFADVQDNMTIAKEVCRRNWNIYAYACAYDARHQA